MTLLRMDNVGIVVESLDDAISFFAELGLKLEGRAMVEGEWAGRVTGLGDQRVEIAMMVTPDGHSRLELSRFLTPPVVADHRNAPVNALGYLRVMFAVEDIDETLARLRKRGAQLVGEVVQYEDVVSALLHPRPRRTSHRARRADWVALAKCSVGNRHLRPQAKRIDIEMQHASSSRPCAAPEKPRTCPQNLAPTRSRIR